MPELLNTPCAAVAAGILRGALIGLHRRETHAALFLAALMLAGHAAVAMIVCGRSAPWLSPRNGMETVWQLVALAPLIAGFAARDTWRDSSPGEPNRSGTRFKLRGVSA